MQLSRLVMRIQSLDIYQLIKVATPLMLQRKKSPGENMCQMLNQRKGLEIEKATG